MHDRTEAIGSAEPIYLLGVQVEKESWYYATVYAAVDHTAMLSLACDVQQSSCRDKRLEVHRESIHAQPNAGPRFLDSPVKQHLEFNERGRDRDADQEMPIHTTRNSVVGRLSLVLRKRLVLSSDQQNAVGGVFPRSWYPP